MADPFLAEIGSDGLVYMKLVGSLTKENYDVLKASVEHAKQLVKTLSEEKRGMVKVMFDMTEFTGTYNVGAMTLMKELADHNRPYVARSAVFGGPDLARVAADITISLIGDPTIKLFKEQMEAKEWLMK